MVQEYLTYIIVFLAFFLTAFKIVRSFTRPKKSCSDCFHSCEGCSLKLLSEQMKDKKAHQHKLKILKLLSKQLIIIIL